MIIETTPTDVAHGGYCVARHEGVVVFISGALVGERLRVEITSRRSKVWYARVVEVLEPSPDRIDLIWPLAARQVIGGADLGHVSLEAGRVWKAQVIQTQLRRLAHLERVVTVEGIASDTERAGLAWRTRLSLQVDNKGRLGLFGAKTHQVQPIDGMPLAHEAIQEAIARELKTGRVQQAPGPRLYVQASGSGLAVHPARTSFTIVEQVKTSDAVWTYQVAGDGFWQVHRQAGTILVEAVRRAVGDWGGPIFDLYAGAGLFTLPLAALGLVTAIEGSPSAVQNLRTNTAGLEVRPLSGDVAAVLERIEPTPGSVMVCDPPRSGAGRLAVEQMARIGPERVVYVACDPAALARDIATFADLGYTLTDLRAFDLFPMTHHVECVAVLDQL
ncbi:MAG: TRAM domain-containing protein [Propionibacteriaceae bacterium]|jgi:tRNA/tmRNA/rRNA uracil-C5-methylase (TrmA/RlmC/RlmD family)|nr:TRAM domain-containing protein [Propionibacteriaceae bacterium]